MKQQAESSDALERIYMTRRENLRMLASAPSSPGELGGKLGFSSQYLSQLIGANPTRTVSEKAARRIEDVLGLNNGWLDVAR